MQRKENLRLFWHNLFVMLSGFILFFFLVWIMMDGIIKGKIAFWIFLPITITYAITIIYLFRFSIKIIKKKNGEINWIVFDVVNLFFFILYISIWIDLYDGKTNALLP